MTLAWLFTVSMTVRGVVREKESRLKEVMKLPRIVWSVLKVK